VKLSRHFWVVTIVAILAIASACNGSSSDGLPVRNTGHFAIVEVVKAGSSPPTDRGTFVMELYPKVAPKTVENFETLVKKGFYNGLTFHRVVADFVVQGGDPDGTGMGGPGYTVPAEIDKNEHHLRGSVATARTGDEVNPKRESSGSQFYICMKPQPGLDGDYTIFGGVIKGMDVVDQIQKGDHMKKITLATEPPK
jgi:cyclophilin family peptidyl-prolyl cis-trans isomerase